MSDATNKWEYTTLKILAKDCFPTGTLDQTLFDSRLNQLGKDGWELVSIFDTTIIKDVTDEIIAVLKRPRKIQSQDTQLFLKTMLPDQDP